MFLRFCLFVLACLLVPAVGSAQQNVTSRTVTAAAGPRRELTATAVRAPARADTASVALARRQNMGKPVAMMIVGGAALVVGLIIGGDVGALFAIGGAVVGLIGLYQYLQ